jgi:hypothetical protein
MPGKVLADLQRRLEPLARASSPLSAPPPRKTRFGSPLILSQVHWLEPQFVAEITYLTLDHRRTLATGGLRRAPIGQASGAGAKGSGASLGSASAYASHRASICYRSIFQ